MPDKATSQKRAILLKLTNDGVFYNPTGKVMLEQTNLPVEAFRFKTYYDIFWRAEMISYDKKQASLEVRITDYNPTETDSFELQNPKNKVNKLIFSQLSWERLVPHLSFYQEIAFEKLLAQPITFKEEKKNQILQQNNEKKITFTCSITDFTFDLGFVHIRHHDQDLAEDLDIKIYNDAILPEFDHIKPFFIKVLGKRKCSVWATVFFENEDISEIKAYSPQIASINEKTISSVKYLHTKQIFQEPKVVGVDKSLFTSEDIFESASDQKLGNTFRMNDQDLLKSIMKIKGVRNARQLEYLAGRLQSKKEKLRFTLSPLFGFLFFIEGEAMDHYIWELLNSHATYLWSFDRQQFNRKEQYQKVQDIINFIRNNGRDQYKRHTRQKDYVFSFIRHEKAGSSFIDGFPLWKSKLEEKLI